MSIIVTFFIYSLTILTSSLAFSFAVKNQPGIIRNFFILIALTIPVLISGFRYAVGTDYISYISGFKYIQLDLDVRWRLEYGYFLLNKILIMLGLGPQSIMFASSLITITFIIKALLKKHVMFNVGLGLLTFMLLFYLSSFNIIRMMIAVSIFLYNISNIEDRKLLKFIIFSIIAASFHISAIITIPAYWLYSLSINKRIVKSILLFFGVFLFIIYFDNIINFILSTLSVPSLEYYQSYLGTSNKTHYSAFKKIILYLPLIIPGPFIYKKCEECNKGFRFYYLLLVIGVIITVLATFRIAYVDRLAQYFLITVVMVLPVYIKVFKENRNIVLYCGLISYLFIFFIYIYFILNNHGTVPYQWIFYRRFI